MKLTATQAHTLNLLRSAHDSIVSTTERMTDLALDTAGRLSKGYTDQFNDLAGITGLVTELARLVSMRETVKAVAATFLDEATVVRVMTGPFVFYMEGSELVTEVEHGDYLQELRDQLAGGN